MKKLFIITGEHSGDKHAADVVKHLQKADKNLVIEAIGGQNLANTEIKLFGDHSKMSAAGISFKIIIDHIMLGKKLLDYLNNEFKPDMVLLVDYGGFNLRIAAKLKKLGTKIYYYIPPQIWASRKWRIINVKRYIDKVITIFPFETKMYKDAEVDVEFAGNPLLQQIPPKPDKKEFFKEHGFNPDKKLISIFPGSRKFEIKQLLSTFVKAAEIIKEKYPDIQFAISQAPTIKDGWFENKIPENIKIIKNKNYEMLASSDALILASGTVALEAALYETPMIVSYKGPWALYFIYLVVRCIRMISLPNIILGEKVVPELVQRNATADKIASSLLQILENEHYKNDMINSLKHVKELLSKKISAENTSKIILSNI